MNASREMDVEVALRVMHWYGPVLWVEDDEGRDPYLFPPDAKEEHVDADDRDWDHIVPHFSTSTDDALDVWRTMQDKGITLEVDPAQTPAFAICAAALAVAPND